MRGAPCGGCLGFLAVPRGGKGQLITRDLRLAALSPRGRGGRTPPRLCLTRAPDPGRRLRASYDASPVECIGQGGYGSVYKVGSKAAGCWRAVKQISKDGVSRDAICRELQMLLALDHPHIVRLMGWFEDDFSVYLVTELATCGDLKGRAPCASSEAARLFGQLMAAVRYFHGYGIAHRDLKAQNCLLTGDPRAPTLKVIDFGLAMLRGAADMPGRWLDGRAGTLSHMAPEVLDPAQKYGVKCDIWSAGVVLYVLLTGAEPFPEGCGQQAGAGSGGALPPRLAAPLAAAGAGALAEDLVARLLRRAPGARPDAEEVLRHEWLAGAVERRLHPKVLRRVAAWSLSEASPLRAAVATATAYTLGEEDVADIRETFAAIDAAAVGYLSKPGIGDACRRCGLHLDEGELAELFDALDRERVGRVAWTDWLTAALPPHMIASEDRLRQALMFFDLNMSGSVSPGELSAVLGSSCAEDALVRWDSDRDQRLSLSDVKAAMEDLAFRKRKLSETPKQAPLGGA